MSVSAEARTRKGKTMFFLTNHQRACLGLSPVGEDWDWAPLHINSDRSEIWLCFDGDTLRRCVHTGPARYQEDVYEEATAEGRTVLLPRTAKGKPKKLSVSALQARKPRGTYFSWYGSTGGIRIGSYDLRRTYYSNGLEGGAVRDQAELSDWLDRWAAETTPEDLAELAAFNGSRRRHVKFREGDFFRFKVGRRQYGYGRILLDYQRMRKNGIPFWDVLLGGALAAKVYHIISDSPDVPIRRLRELPALPGQLNMDNRFFYGEYEIVGNLPLATGELDCPIYCGGSIDCRERDKVVTLFQCGRVYRRLEGERPRCGMRDFMMNGISLGFFVKRSMWDACIAAGNNGPYWADQARRDREIEAARSGLLRLAFKDLRNPAYRDDLDVVCAQMGLAIGELPICLE